MKIRFSRQFQKQYNKADIKIQNLFNQKLKLFSENQFHPQLNNHRLTGKLSGYRSINVTGDWRAIYSMEQVLKEDLITFEVLGTHSQLYK